MNTKTILIRNIPSDLTITHRINVKPVFFLIGLSVIGIIMMIMRSVYLIPGLVIVLVSLFGLFVMPERNLCSFSEDYLILYNQRDKNYCRMVDWKDIVSWSYEKHKSSDQLAVVLTDGTTELQDMFSKSRLEKYMNEYIPGKELKKSSRKR